MCQFFLRINMLEILEQFGTENYTWRFDIVQKLCEFFLSDFLVQNVVIFPCPKWANTPGWQNVLIPPYCILLNVKFTEVVP